MQFCQVHTRYPHQVKTIYTRTIPYDAEDYPEPLV